MLVLTDSCHRCLEAGGSQVNEQTLLVKALLMVCQAGAERQILLLLNTGQTVGNEHFLCITA